MFADDTNLSTSGFSLLEVENRISNDLHNVNVLLERNQFTLNTEKNNVC